MLGNETTSKLWIKFAVPVMVIVMLISLGIVLLAGQALISRVHREAGKERQLKINSLQQDLATTRRLMLDRVREAMRVYQNQVSGKKPTFAPSVQLNGRTIPNLMLDNASLIENNQLVLDVSDRTGATVAVYVRDVNDRFVAVASNLNQADGAQGVGDELEASSQAWIDLQSGKTHYNIGAVGNRAIARGLEPIREAGGRILGAWSISFPVSFTDLSKQVTGEKILTNGFLAIADQKGNVIAKSADAPEKLLPQFVSQTAKESVLDGWNVQRADVADWNYAVVAGYTNRDPQIGAEMAQITTWTLLIALLVSVLLGGVVVMIAMRVTSRLEEAVDVAEKLAEGDLSVELAVTSRDEIGRLQRSMLKMLEYLRETAEAADKIAAGDMSVKVVPRSTRDRFGIALRNMLENLLRLVQSQEERDTLQGSIMKLLDEVADVAEGDLTGQAEVTADATGAIADAFNYMIDELRDIVRQVKDTAQAVNLSTGDIRSTTDKLNEGSQMQARQIAETSTAVEQIAASIHEVSNSAQASAEVATGALSTAQNGARAVQNNIAAMTRIRSQVQETAKRIKKLGERSQEIDEIVQIIDELADRTSILALNASLKAAAAGEAGRGFVVVAEEVERLAERSTQATQRIAGLTRTIQLETKDVVASMEDTIREVVDGSQLANEAGNALQEIETVSTDLAKLIQNISQTARKQAVGSEDIARSMTGISEITTLVAEESRHTAVSVKSLVSLTEKLRGSVATFKLPEALDKTGKLPNLN